MGGAAVMLLSHGSFWRAIPVALARLWSTAAANCYSVSLKNKAFNYLIYLNAIKSILDHVSAKATVLIEFILKCALNLARVKIILVQLALHSTCEYTVLHKGFVDFPLMFP